VVWLVRSRLLAVIAVVVYSSNYIELPVELLNVSCALAPVFLPLAEPANNWLKQQKTPVEKEYGYTVKKTGVT